MSATTTTPTKTFKQLTTDPTPWTMADIALNLAVKSQTVRSWRKDSLAAERPDRAAAVPHPNHLPKPDIPVTGKPAWTAGCIRRWAIQTGRMSPQGAPLRLRPPGRPRAKAA